MAGILSFQVLPVGSSGHCPHSAGQTLLLTPALCSYQGGPILLPQDTTLTVLAFPKGALPVWQVTPWCPPPTWSLQSFQAGHESHALHEALLGHPHPHHVSLSPDSETQFSTMCHALVPTCHFFFFFFLAVTVIIPFRGLFKNKKQNNTKARYITNIFFPLWSSLSEGRDETMGRLHPEMRHSNTSGTYLTLKE